MPGARQTSAWNRPHEGDNGYVIVTCPTTGTTVEIGIETDSLTFRTINQLHANETVRCPACGEEHLWRCLDARLVEPNKPPTRRHP